MPSTVSLTPPGLPSLISTARRNIRLFDVPPADIGLEQVPAARSDELNPAVLGGPQVNDTVAAREPEPGGGTAGVAVNGPVKTGPSREGPRGVK